MISITSINYLLKSKFNNLYIKDIKVLSSKGEYITCLINDDYIFHIILNPKQNIDYSKEKENLSFLRKQLDTSLSIPDITYLYISDDIVIKGYKQIEGIPLNTNIIRLMNIDDQDILAKDIANFLKKLHSLLKYDKCNYKEVIKNDISLIKEYIYDLLSSEEKDYVSNLESNLERDINIHECLSHNALSYSRLIINRDNKLVGIVGFDQLDLGPNYIDFIPLLEDDEFAKKIINYYSDINYEDLISYKNIMDLYYPISIIAYGIKNNRNDIIERGRRLISEKQKTIQYE